MKKIDQIYLKILVWLHNYIYHKISQVSTKLNDNIHPKHRIMNYHKFFLDNIEKDSKVLDIGCGIGILTYNISNKAQRVIAIDINENSIKKARTGFNNSNIKYLVCDATKINFNENFDYIILSNILEHIKDRTTFLRNIKSLTKYILIRVPMINRSWLAEYKKECGFEYRLHKSHYIEYTLDSFKDEIESIGLTILTYSIQYGEIWSKIMT